ncbi:hypothetical protein [Chitinophaga ginsengisegetis]|uniref:hypothetical protein n=1 Tax=Chitinophaga ginsengisegetis TaxID=393003 RepID=UPI000DB9575A|nr:hypothetical protein [Chitinophaga ginsengisegetis]MDR6569161.1 hypothetical protein [Chitinophaga ginsengisegetis]MDR6648809.1 hypothetical protein [Chitinophaga ginsengisegetis]MDR6655243.1 hypothetical protein [Chitinophaga ginsengisegetis]
MIKLIQDKITKVVIEWNLDLQSLANSKEIIVIKFGAQMVYHGFELYLSGYTWYDDHDLWLFDEIWSPNKNYISLGKESLEFDRLIILEEYENILKKEITNSKDLYRDFIVVVGLVDGEIKRLK